MYFKSWASKMNIHISYNMVLHWHECDSPCYWCIDFLTSSLGPSADAWMLTWTHTHTYTTQFVQCTLYTRTHIHTYIIQWYTIRIRNFIAISRSNSQMSETCSKKKLWWLTILIIEMCSAANGFRFYSIGFSRRKSWISNGDCIHFPVIHCIRICTYIKCFARNRYLR